MKASVLNLHLALVLSLPHMLCLRGIELRRSTTWLEMLVAARCLTQWIVGGTGAREQMSCDDQIKVARGVCTSSGFGGDSPFHVRHSPRAP